MIWRRCTSASWPDAAVRVLLITDFYFPYTGGVEHHVRELAHGLAGRGHEVVVATLGADTGYGDDRDGPVRVRRISGLVHRFDALFASDERPWAPPLPDPGLARALRRILTEEQPDVVHGHDWLLRSVLPVLPRSIPLVSTLHYYSRSCARKNLLRNGVACPGPSPLRCVPCSGEHYGWAKGMVVLAGSRIGAAWERRATEVTIAVSTACAEGNESRIDDVAIIANSRIEGTPAQTVPGLPEGDYAIYVGDLRPEKGVPVMLEAYSRLKRRPPLVIVGAGEVPSPFDELDGIYVLGERPHTEVLTAFAGSMFAVVPSIWEEPFGLVVLEAMAAGVPVVASNVGGIIDIVTHDHDGLLAEVGDPSSFAQAMAALVDDPERRRRLGLAAAETAQRFSPAAMIAEIEAAYLEASQGAAR